jgi:tetratricopeptide (TPR) repeat protein
MASSAVNLSCMVSSSSSVMMREMTGTTTLYPLELFRLLEVMWEDRFAGSVILRARDETTALYLEDGRVRYATTTEVSGTFPGYLLTEQFFSRDQVHEWLAHCGAGQTTLEDRLLSEEVLDASAIVAMKTDLCHGIFARAFSAGSTAEVKPTRGDPLLFGDLELNPYEGLFQCVSEGQALPHRINDLTGYTDRGRLVRSHAFFRLWPLFKRWFDPSFVGPLFASPDGLKSLGGSRKERSLLLTYTYLLRETGMASFEGEPSRTASMSRPRARPERAPVNVAQAPQPEPKLLRREATVPGGLPVISVPNQPGPLAPPPPANPSRRAAPAPRSTRQVAIPIDPSESFADLRGNLVGADLIESAEDARGQSCYAFLEIGPQAPLSEIRAAWQIMRRRYEEERHRGLMLQVEAKTALKELQKRTEAAYDTLTDLRRRFDHDVRFAVQDAQTKDVLEDVFYAEGLFKAAQIRLTEERYVEAAELLDEAFIRNPMEPEYLSYLAFTFFNGRVAGVAFESEDEDPDGLLTRALAMDSRLESAWLFRARIADQQGHASRAMGAYLTVLDIDAHNDEASRAVRAFKEAGVNPAGRLRRELAQRLGRLLGRRGAG